LPSFTLPSATPPSVTPQSGNWIQIKNPKPLVRCQLVLRVCSKHFSA
jgi:hypothetical protein